MSATHDQSGFTLVEILIAVVIFSIDLLGIAGLLVSGMRFTHDSQLRSIACQSRVNLVPNGSLKVYQPGQ